MGYEAPELREWLKQDIREAQAQGSLGEEEAESVLELYSNELIGYTYLEQV